MLKKDKKLLIVLKKQEKKMEIKNNKYLKNKN